MKVIINTGKELEAALKEFEEDEKEEAALKKKYNMKSMEGFYIDENGTPKSLVDDKDT